jgi:hypothetical protein
MFAFVRWATLAFSLLLVAAGWPLVAPDPAAALSQAPAYAVFHLVGAAAGLALFAWNRGALSPWFALVFGLLDLYQALAASLHWFPQSIFQWTATDDVVHLVYGTALVALGALALVFPRRAR